MIVSILTLIFFVITLVLGLSAKRILYTNEHVASIQNELKTFDENFKSIENIDVLSDYKVGSDHIYK